MAVGLALFTFLVMLAVLQVFSNSGHLRLLAILCILTAFMAIFIAVKTPAYSYDTPKRIFAQHHYFMDTRAAQPKFSSKKIFAGLDSRHLPTKVASLVAPNSGLLFLLIDVAISLIIIIFNEVAAKLHYQAGYPVTGHEFGSLYPVKFVFPVSLLIHMYTHSHSTVSSWLAYTNST